jgi:hypothetical protein
MNKYRVDIANKEDGFVYYKDIVKCEPDEIQSKARQMKTETNTVTVYEVKEEIIFRL